MFLAEEEDLLGMMTERVVEKVTAVEEVVVHLEKAYQGEAEVVEGLLERETEVLL